MKILLFGGTTEGRLLAERLVGMGHQVTVSVATEWGAEILQGQWWTAVPRQHRSCKNSEAMCS